MKNCLPLRQLLLKLASSVASSTDASKTNACHDIEAELVTQIEIRHWTWIASKFIYYIQLLSEECSSLTDLEFANKADPLSFACTICQGCVGKRNACLCCEPL